MPTRMLCQVELVTVVPNTMLVLAIVLGLNPEVPPRMQSTVRANGFAWLVGCG